MKIRTTQNTLGKISTAQAGTLEPHEANEIEKGKEFVSVREEEGHYVVELHIFKDHADLLPEQNISHRKINEEGKALIKKFEGLRTESYLCPANVWTIGYGSTDGVRKGMNITAVNAEALLDQDLQRFEKGVEKLVTVPLNDNQFSALVSFAFNLGLGALKRSTLLKRLNQGNYQAVPQEFSKWIWADNRTLPGLVTRRKEEAELFMKL
ncbi:MAG: lysozyme [Cyanobacteria bacterium P01_E01_bin.6]